MKTRDHQHFEQRMISDEKTHSSEALHSVVERSRFSTAAPLRLCPRCGQKEMEKGGTVARTLSDTWGRYSFLLWSPNTTLGLINVSIFALTELTATPTPSSSSSSSLPHSLCGSASCCYYHVVSETILNYCSSKRSEEALVKLKPALKT